ncbi:MAG: hypothetical protein P0Y59_07945 [Candidatus Sphingomonas phytovorans]|nr:hypothetical protein [Sphingomonas sp.]WEK01593.1 MAG: hypothetical protein P0Y59_07945 [Sphingomonas sp.]
MNIRTNDQRAAILYSLIVIAKLKDVLARIAEYPALWKSNINREQSAFIFSVAWLRLAAWDY